MNDRLRQLGDTLRAAAGRSGDHAARSQARGTLVVVAVLLVAGGLLVAGLIRNSQPDELTAQTVSATRDDPTTTVAPAPTVPRSTTTIRPTTTAPPATSTTRPTSGSQRSTGVASSSGTTGGLLVVDVIDGDTIDVEGGVRVRLIGIDTPERGECGFESASSMLASMVAGRRVNLIPGARDNADRYGRLLRYVEADGTDAGYSLITSGLAIARYDGLDGYGWHPRQDRYRAADASAPPSGGCPDQSSGGGPTPVPFVGGGVPDPNVPATPVPNGGGNSYFANCDAARAIGAAPLYVGTPGYRPGLDRDGDGVACERRR